MENDTKDVTNFLAYYLIMYIKIMWPVTKASKQLEGTTAGVTRFGAGVGGTVGGEGSKLPLLAYLLGKPSPRGS